MAASSAKRVLSRQIELAQVDDILRRELKDAGYSGVEMVRKPAERGIRTHVIVRVLRPRAAIAGGEGVRRLKEILMKELNVDDEDLLEVGIVPVEAPELDPHVMAQRIASALERGIHFRRAGFWALNAIMDAGALGAEISIKGKLRTERAAYEKYRAGYLLRVGELAVKGLREAVVHVQLKPGMYGIKVRILPPGIETPDLIKREEEVEEVALTEA